MQEATVDTKAPANAQKLTASNIIGYALGDTGGVLAFGVISTFLNMYYTDVFGINAAQIAILFLVARVWDAINDPIMGGILDRLKPRKTGRFRPWIYFFSFPMIISLICLFLPVNDWFNMSSNQLLIYAYITYIFYGMMYTENRFKTEPESEAGAQGVLQVIPSTWRTMYKELQQEYPEIAATIVDDPTDKASNITIGLYYIKYLKDYYGYSSLKEHASQILTCYNRGPGGTASYYNKYGTYSTDYSKEILRAADYIRENGTWEEGL